MDIIINIAVFLISAVIFTFVGFFIRKKLAESKLQSAENEAKRILDLAAVEAENKKKEEIFKAKEEIMAARKDLDTEIRERRGEVQQQERRIVQKEENLDRKTENLERKEKELEDKKTALNNQKNELDNVIQKQLDELQKISGLSKDEAKKQLLDEMEKQIVAEKAALLREIETKTKEDAEKNAKQVIGYAIQNVLQTILLKQRYPLLLFQMTI